MAQNEQDQEFDPGALLIQTLTESAAGLTEEASLKMMQSSVDAIKNETEAQAPKVAGDDITNDLYIRLASNDITTFPAGTKIISKTSKFGSVQKDIDPTTGKITITNTPILITSNINPTQTARKIYSDASQSFPITFDIDTELTKLKGLRGAELESAITGALSIIDTEITKQRQIIGRQAAVESGYSAAQAALDRSLQAEHIPNPNFGGLSFNQRFGFASAQTQQAEAFASATRIQMFALERSMIEKDLTVSKLISAKNAILKMEIRTAERQMKEDEKLDAITSSMVANYKFIYGNTDDLNARRTIASRINRDPVLAKTISITPENIFLALTDPDAKVRLNAKQLVLDYDKATNNLSEDVKETDSTKFLAKLIANPDLIAIEAQRQGLISKEAASQFISRMAGVTPKEAIELRQQQNANLLERLIERKYLGSYQNMKYWKANELDPKSPLGIIRDRVASKSINGNAPLATVIDIFIQDRTIKTPDGQIMPFDARMQILDSALNGAITNDIKTILYPNTDPLRVKMLNQIKNMTARAFVRANIYSPEQTAVIEQQIIREQLLSGQGQVQR